MRYVSWVGAVVLLSNGLGSGCDCSGERRPSETEASSPADEAEPEESPAEAARSTSEATASDRSGRGAVPAYHDALREGRRAAHDERHARAIEHFREALRHRPGDTTAQCELGWAAFRAGDLSLAAHRLDGATRRVPQTGLSEAQEDTFAACLYNRGRVAEERGDARRAADYYRRSLELRDDDIVRERLSSLDVSADATPAPVGSQGDEIRAERPSTDWLARLAAALQSERVVAVSGDLDEQQSRLALRQRDGSVVCVEDDDAHARRCRRHGEATDALEVYRGAGASLCIDGDQGGRELDLRVTEDGAVRQDTALSCFDPLPDTAPAADWFATEVDAPEVLNVLKEGLEHDERRWIRLSPVTTETRGLRALWLALRPLPVLCLRPPEGRWLCGVYPAEELGPMEHESLAHVRVVSPPEPLHVTLHRQLAESGSDGDDWSRRLELTRFDPEQGAFEAVGGLTIGWGGYYNPSQRDGQPGDSWAVTHPVEVVEAPCVRLGKPSTEVDCCRYHDSADALVPELVRARDRVERSGDAATPQDRSGAWRLKATGAQRAAGCPAAPPHGASP